MLAPLCSIVGMMVSSVGFSDENKGSSLHDRRARADEGNVGVLDLAYSRAPRSLQRAFDDVPQPVDASGTQTSAEGIERQFAVELHAPILNEVERFAFFAEAVRF